MRLTWFSLFVLVSSAAFAFEGTYSSQKGDAWQTATVVKRGPATYAVEMSIGVPGCLGELEATGTANGNVLRIDKEDEVEICHLVATKKNGGLEVKELTCDSHGRTCSFSGFYAKAKSGAK